MVRNGGVPKGCGYAAIVKGRLDDLEVRVRTLERVWWRLGGALGVLTFIGALAGGAIVKYAF